MFRASQAKAASVAPVPSGGVVGNLSGDLADTYIPIATGLHTLGNSPLHVTGGVVYSDDDVQIGGVYLARGGGGGVTSGQIHATGLSFLDGLVTLGGNLLASTGTLTALHVHATGTSAFDGNVSVGANILLDPTAGQVTTEFLHVTSDTGLDGVVHIGGNVLVNTNKFTIDATTGNTAIAGTLSVPTIASDVDFQGKVTQEKSTIKLMRTVVPTGSAPSWTAAIDLALADAFYVGPAGAGNTVISNPINIVGTSGYFQRFIIRVATSATSANTMSWGTAYNFLGGVPVIDWSVAGVHYFEFIYNENSGQYDCFTVNAPQFSELGRTPSSFKFTLGYAAFAALGAVNEGRVLLCTLPAGTKCSAILGAATVSFAGGTISNVALAAGIVSGGAFQATYLDAIPGAAGDGQFNPAGFMSPLSAATPVYLDMITTGGLLNALTAGSVDVYMELSRFAPY